MKTLIVKYIPRNGESNTEKLLDAFKAEIINSEVEELDLCIDVPDMLLKNNLLAHIKRNILGQKLSAFEERLLHKVDRMSNQLRCADNVIVVFPMYNFSMPSVVKAWFDSVMQRGVTFGRSSNGQIVSNVGKKALVMISCGGTYEDGSTLEREHALSLAKLEFQFMGYTDVRGVMSEGMAKDDEIKYANLNSAIRTVRDIAREWYKIEDHYNLINFNPDLKKSR